MRFNSVNERGWLQRLEDDPPIFQFKYDNDFYGSCSFQATIVESDHEVLRLDEETLKVEDFSIRKGNLPILVQTAKAFLRIKLTSHTRLKQLDKRAARIRRNLFDWRSTE